MKESESTTLTFVGAAGTVTGSRTLLEHNNKRVLVDCGLFQGLKDLRVRNWELFPIAPQSIDEVILTHAHLDHCGYLPKLVREGFRGPIHCTHPTIDLCRIILEDSAKIQEEEAERAMRHGYSHHAQAKPLYNLKDVEIMLGQLVGHDYSEWVLIDPVMKFQLHNAGHILGSAMVEMELNDLGTIVFSGDLGNSDPLLMRPPKHLKKADYIVIESTYGDRLHPQITALEEIKHAVNRADEKNGVLIIPTFAVERAQEIIYLLSELKAADKIPGIPVFLDSPMGANATEVFLKYPEWHILGEQRCKTMCRDIHIVKDVAHSKSVLADDNPKIVLAGSGMVTGGRVLHYLAKYISNPDATVLLAGFQAVGTRGRQLQEGVQEIKFFGEWHKVRAEIIQTTSLSAHGDQRDLLAWIAHFGKDVRRVYVNHGEPNAGHTFMLKVEDELGIRATVVEHGYRYKPDG